MCNHHLLLSACAFLVFFIKANTFQCIIGNDANSGSSFVILLYADDLIEWTTGDRDGGINGIGGNPALVGFVDDDGTQFAFDGSGTSEVINIDTTSNKGFGGVWCFRTDGTQIQTPCE